ncbi:hypothetical protein JHK87_038692 [Glycine soja]|nr:hypothetical protein JHK87_038692 [Glycine soja]
MFLTFVAPQHQPLSGSRLASDELVGRSSPIFISHRLQERLSSGHNYSEDIIVTFDLFEHDNAGTASVSTYTAVSPLRFMHDDICYLALDKLASIILLPFHIRWGEDGGVESTDENMRTLNSKVLERAPCSVGILVNRSSSSSTHQSPLMKQIAMIFLGVADDREALCLARRTIKDYDFGRRNGIKSPQTAALESWTEFSELGVIGDLLASSDTNTNASILVVQQQQMPKSS